MVTNQINDFILLDMSHVYLGANLACSNDKNLEVNTTEFMRDMAEEQTLGEIDLLSVSANRL